MEFEKNLGLGLLVVLVLIIIILTLTWVTGFRLSTSEGKHTGYITAVEKTGVIFKTYKAYIKTDTQSSQEEAYCVIDKEVVEELRQAQESNSKVTIEFSNGHFVPLTQCGGTEESIIRSVI